MAERRMFAKTIIDSDAFLDMPSSAQALYFHMAMRADDEGFLNNPKKIQRIVGASDDDCKLLLAKGFIIRFDSGVVVIKHWRIHNYIQKDRFKPTVYQEERAELDVKDNGAYTKCVQDVYSLETQVRLGKDSIGKDSIGEGNLTLSNEMVCCTDVQRVIEAWNSLNLTKITKIVDSTNRGQWLKKRIQDYGVDEVLRAIENVRNSAFLMGDNKKGWVITFDWFIRPNNFPKVLDGNYDGNQIRSNGEETNNPFLKMILDGKVGEE